MKKDGDIGITPENNRLGQLMKNLIKDSGLKQIRVCEGLNLSPSRLSNYLSGSREPSLKILSEFANFFNCSLDYFNLCGLHESRSDVFLRQLKEMPEDEVFTLTVAGSIGVEHFEVPAIAIYGMLDELRSSENSNMEDDHAECI